MMNPLETPNFMAPNYPAANKCMPQPSDYVDYACTVNGRSEPYPTSRLYYIKYGAVVAGVVNPPNTALAPDPAVTVSLVNVVESPN